MLARGLALLGSAASFGIALLAAALVALFPLPDTAEAAPVYTA